MTTPLSRNCPTCNAEIPPGALYCLRCGASSPTEIADTVQERRRQLRLTLDLPARQAEVQAALGPGFEVRGLLGRGGFGEVWAAQDLQLGRAVAVKVLRADLADQPDYRERFHREARAIARLRHPGIVPIYHVGESNGLTWFIMPLIEGITLKAALAQPGGLTLAESVRILGEAASALRVAHAGGIIHRDLKPENIMLEGPSRRVLLMDFGVAKMDEADGEVLTEADVVLGSPEYMSPEQATGRVLDARTDIYSLGVVAYRMFAGRLPFDAATPREVLAHHVLTAPEPIGRHVELPAALAEAVMRCLAKSPDDRWSSAAELLEALDPAARRHVPLPAAPRSYAPALAAGEPDPAARRGRRALFVAVALGLVVLAAAPWPVARWRQQRRVRSAVAGVAGVVRVPVDSLRVLSALFARGDLPASRYADARLALLAAADERLDGQYGAVLEDTVHWTGSERIALRDALAPLHRAGQAVNLLQLRPSDEPGCRLQESGDTVRVADEAQRANCWWRTRVTPSVAAPVEYFVAFRLPRTPPPDAGLGLAWCRADDDCRVAFTWATSPTVWGMLGRRGLATIQLGARGPLRAGDHELRVRYQDDRIRIWLDGILAMQRDAGDEAAYLTQPATVQLVVQNTGVELPSVTALGAVSARP